MSSSMGRIIPYILEKKCLKPPARRKPQHDEQLTPDENIDENTEDSLDSLILTVLSFLVGYFLRNTNSFFFRAEHPRSSDRLVLGILVAATTGGLWLNQSGTPKMPKLTGLS